MKNKIPEKIEIDELWGFKLNELGEKFNSLIDYLHSQKEGEKCDKLVNHYDGAHLCPNLIPCSIHEEKEKRCVEYGSDGYTYLMCHYIDGKCKKCGRVLGESKPTEQEEVEKIIDIIWAEFGKNKEEIKKNWAMNKISLILSHSNKQAKEQEREEIRQMIAMIPSSDCKGGKAYRSVVLKFLNK